MADNVDFSTPRLAPMDIAKGLIYKLESERVGIQSFSIDTNF